MSSSSSDLLTPDQIEFTNAFNRQRGTLAGFAKCSNQEELDVVRDAFYLGLAHDLCPFEYKPIAAQIVTDSSVAASTGTSQGMTAMIRSARASPVWSNVVGIVKKKAEEVGSDPEAIWKTLEQGRLEWLRAVNSAHSIKGLLKKTLIKGAADNPKSPNNNDAPPAVVLNGDISDAKMIWIYGLSLNIKELQQAAATWAQVVRMSNPTEPLVGYQAILWDPRHEDWRALDLGTQAAAEGGGSTLEAAWEA